MNDTGDRLRRILREEQRRGYDDRVVAGGVDAFLRRLANGQALATEPELRKAVLSLPPQGYGALGPDQRREWAQRALRHLPEANGGAPSPSTGRGRPARTPTSRAPGHRTATRRAPTRVAPKGPATLEAPVEALPRVRRDLARRLGGMGVGTVRDLVLFFPHRHADYARTARIAELRPGEETTVIADVWSSKETQIGRRMKGTEAIVGDDTGTLRVVWFNQPWVAKQLAPGRRIVLSGKATAYRGRLVMESPEWEPLDADLTHTGRLVPVYPLTAGLAQRSVRKLVKSAVDTYAEHLPETLPEGVLARQDLPPIADAVRQMHYPNSEERFAAARRRLAFDELLVIELGALTRRRAHQDAAHVPELPLPDEVRDGFIASLPFALTDAQRRVSGDILGDLARPEAMSRLLQGDVGSGKTVVATLALLAAVVNGYQSAIMAPTEILAEQHYRTVVRLFAPEETPALELYGPSYLDRPLRIGRLIGGMSAREKARVTEAVASGEIDIVIGTQALIQETVRFRDLRVVVVDEQHRFGVLQRANLREKSAGAHLLVMTATPIPRTLALTVYGDLDVSVIDELPPGRIPVRTVRVAPHERDEAYAFVRGQIAAGRQAFVICPLVEESEALQVRAATQEFERLRDTVFPDLRDRMGLLHGRMPGRQKDATMRAFAAGEIAILVSTAVVEVGIDVPNATVMMIEGADRFGLAQLHQFRGRVGRGAERSVCLLLAESPSDDAAARLRLMEETTDGFRLAEADLEMRGPGEYFGTRQSGLPDLKVARLTDLDLIRAARDEAGRILDADAGMVAPQHRALREAFERAWAGREETIVGVSD